MWLGALWFPPAAPPVSPPPRRFRTDFLPEEDRVRAHEKARVQRERSAELNAELEARRLEKEARERDAKEAERLEEEKLS